MDSALNRRAAMGLIAASGLALSFRLPPLGVAAAQTRSTRPAVPLSSLGVDRFSSRDQWNQLRAAFAAAAHEGFALLGDPDAVYRHDGLLELNGVSFDGQGATFMALSDGPQVIRVTGSHWRLANIRTLGAARNRSADNMKNGLLIGDGAAHPATDFVLENVSVGGAAPGLGFATTGMMFDHAYRGSIVRAQVSHTRADGIHVTNGSSDLVFQQPVSRFTGDDGFAVVSYRSQRQVCRDIRVLNGESHDSRARAFAVVGGRNVSFEGCRGFRSAAAGAYLFGEGSFDTYGAENCSFTDLYLEDCVTGDRLPAGFSNAAIIIGGRSGTAPVRGGTAPMGAVDCRVTRAHVRGCGAACSAGLSAQEGTVRLGVEDLQITQLVKRGSASQPTGIQIAGRDITIAGATLRNIGGLALVALPTAAGRCSIYGLDVEGVQVGGRSPIASHIYFENAAALQQITIGASRFSQGPDRLAISLLPPGKLQLDRVALNGRPAS